MSEEELRKIALRHQAIMPLTRQEHAAAIIAAMSEAVAAERERCARICEAQLTLHGSRKGGSDTADAARRMCALHIRQEPAPDEGAG